MSRQQQYENAIYRLENALKDTDLIRDIVKGYVQELVEPIRAKTEELQQLNNQISTHHAILRDLGKRIEQRQQELAESNEWSGTKQTFVIRQLLDALKSVELPGFYSKSHTNAIKSAIDRTIKRRIDDLFEIACLYRLSNRKTREWSETLKRERRKLAVELRSARQRLRQIESVESQRLRFLATVNAISASSGFPAVPTPQVDAAQITLTSTPLPEKSGIYFLWDGPLIAYVGRSTRLSMRLTVGHQQLCTSDKISYLCIDKKELFYHEAFYIGVCRPWRNGGLLRTI
jgi:hypothetical protein